jgi:glyoxylase-like metal-dependent hydrolase (beta-lactamase superfamily II)
MRLYAFHGGGELADMAVFDPFHPEVGTKVNIPYFFYLVQHPQGNVLFDSGGHPELIDDPRSRLGAAADDFEVTMEAGDDVVSKLREIGIAPADVGHVAHSHLHYDHAGGIEFFPEATHYVQRRELEFAHWPPIYQRGLYVRADFDHPVRWKELTGEHDIFNDGRVVLFSTPGHTAGHQSLLVRLDSRAIILVADAAYLPRNMELGVLPAIVWSPDAMVDSWDRVRRHRDRHDAELIFTHDLAWPDKARLAPGAWYE